MNDPYKIVKQAVDAIITKINNDKLSPTEATVKVASDMKISAEFIKRASEVVNVALSYNHFKKSASEKSADFPIVDQAEVIKKVYNTNEKTANQIRSEWFPSVDTELSEINFTKKLQDPIYKRAYLAIMADAEHDSEVPLSTKAVFEKAANYLERLEKEANDKVGEEIDAKFQVNRNFSSLIEKFARDEFYRTSFAEFESQAYSMFGEKAVPYLDMIYKYSELKEDRGVHDDKYHLFDTCKEAQLFETFMKSVQDFHKISKEAAELQELYKAEKAYMQEAYNKLGELRAMQKAPNDHGNKPVASVPPISFSNPAPEDHDPVLEATKEKLDQSPIDESVLTDKQKTLPHHLKRVIVKAKKKLKKAEDEGVDLVEKQASDLADLLKGISGYASSKNEGGVSRPNLSFGDTANLHRKLLLQELMTVDPIISTMPPHRVAQLYEQFMHFAPELALEKEVARSAIRTMGSGQAVSPYDAQQFVGANTDLIKQRQLEEGKEIGKGIK